MKLLKELTGGKVSTCLKICICPTTFLVYVLYNIYISIYIICNYIQLFCLNCIVFKMFTYYLK